MGASRPQGASYRHVQAVVLRVVGALDMLALVAVVVPRSWLAVVHAALGLGAMPEMPVFDVVLRQMSFTCGLLGVALWLMAADVVRYRPLIVLAGIAYVAAGPTFFAIGTAAGLPWTWSLGSAGTCLAVGVTLLGLLAGERRATGPNEITPPS